MGTPNPWTLASAASLFLPGLFAIWRQPAIVCVLILLAATASTLYHAYDESAFATYDVMAASAVGVLVVIIMLLHMRRYTFWRYNTGLPLLLLVAGLTVYMVGGSSTGNTHPNDVEDYDVYHSVWHLCTTLATLLVTWHPIQLEPVTQLSLATIFSDIWNKNVDEGRLWEWPSTQNDLRP